VSKTGGADQPTRGGFSTKLKFSVYGVFFEFGGALSTP